CSLLFRFKITIDEAGVIAIGHKTDFLRLLFLSDCELIVACRLARIALRKFAEWKQSARKLTLRQLPKKIGLILLRIATAQQPITVRGFIEFDARVIAGRHLFAPDTCCQLIERSKLQTAIAGNARNWRLAIQV